MAIVNLIKTGDPHEDFTALEHIVDRAIELKADILCPGDFIDGPKGRIRMPGTVDGDTHARLMELLSEKGINPKEYSLIPRIQQMFSTGQFEKLPKEKQQELIKLAQGVMSQVRANVTQEEIAELKEYALSTADRAYERFAKIFGKAKEAGLDVMTLGGNHDWIKRMREKMAGVVRFGDVESLVTSHNRIKYAMTHDTKETPGWFAYDPVLSDLLIGECVDFKLGHDIPTEDPSYVAERKRLGNSMEEADIIMYHKAIGDPRDELGGGSFARDTKPEGKPIVGGHLHRTYIGTDNDGNPLIAVGRSDRYIRSQFDTGTKRYVGNIEIWQVPSRYNTNTEAEIVPVKPKEKVKSAA